MSTQDTITTTSDDPTDPRSTNRARFELELEFVQSLANPFYLHSLAQQNILDSPAFVNFLAYLTYWQEKEYARFIQSVPDSFSVSI
jgi:mediator of RNA polymerase II transcription subunit 31